MQCTCCNETRVPYDILHTDKPIELTSDLVRAIEILLWYSPNLKTSSQTFYNEYLKDKEFENAIISYFLVYTSLKSSDLLFIEGDSIPQEYIEPYLGAICESCNKLILTKKSSETRLECMLRHLRNCIAHGRFNIVNERSFIGFDECDTMKSAVLKLQVSDVAEFCTQLINFPDFTIAQIVRLSLNPTYYCVLDAMDGKFNEKYEEIVFIKSKLKDFAVRFNCSRYQESSNIQRLIPVDEFQPKYDDPDFRDDLNYIDVYYCRNERSNVRKISDRKYIMGKTGLKALAAGMDIEVLITKAK